MNVKEGVDLRHLRREIREAFGGISRVHKRMADGIDATITSTTEGRHRVKRSAHYRGDAVDVRTWNVDGQEFADQLSTELGGDFVCLFEHDHVHIHWGPVYRA